MLSAWCPMVVVWRWHELVSDWPEAEVLVVG